MKGVDKMRQFKKVEDPRVTTAWWPVIGFGVLVVLGGLSFALSDLALGYLTSAHLVVGPMTVLPLAFPQEWPHIARQAAVSFILFMIMFVLAMIVMFSFISPASEDDTTIPLDEVRKEKERRKRR
jgi:hypothetical protein